MNTLLVTGTIKPLVKVAYGDPNVRRGEYCRNLKRYICDTKFDRIIFAENSGYAMDVSALQDLASKKGKCFLMLDVSSKADNVNMSTGEVKILQEIISCCDFLKDEDFVWKVSGRVYIRNADRLIKYTENCRSNLFIYAPKYDSLQTWFCRINVGDLKNFFLTENAVEKMRSSCIEYTWMDIWKEHSREITMGVFPTYPDAEGINSSGQPYTLPKHRLLIKNVLLKLGYFTPRADRKLDRSNL